MSDEMFIEGKSYLSSKRAAQSTGYAQDYIGQLARKGLIDAQRIGGLWYIAMDSLTDYKKKAETFKPEPPVVREQKREPSTLVFFDGKEYLSAGRAAEMTGYVQDYVGQLARSGQILSRQVGNRWYVEKESILRHKQEKDGLLAAVQSQAVGLQRSQKIEKKSEATVASEPSVDTTQPLLTYFADTADLLPIIKNADNRNSYVSSQEDAISHITPKEVTPIPIHKEFVPKTPVLPKTHQEKTVSKVSNTKTDLSMPLLAGALATIVIVLSVGYASVLKQNSVYASAKLPHIPDGNLTASVGAAITKIGDLLEPFLTHELVYKRFEVQ